MNVILAAVFDHAARRGRHPALAGPGAQLDYAELARAVEAGAAELRRRGWTVVGLLLDNSPVWVVADLAAALAGITVVPLPPFFSAAQLQHALADAGVDGLITDRPERLDGTTLSRVVPRGTITVAGTDLAALDVAVTASPARDFPKVTYTSGTTGAPKGVCLTAAAIESVTQALLERVGAEAVARHLSLLPLATLLENIGGVYVPLIAGGTCMLLPGAAVGVRGASGLDPARLAAALIEQAATSAILIPQMLQVLVEQAARLPRARFLAVGGAPVSAELLRRARRLGLPVYEGYGLSECASVVALNAPGAERPGSVGRPLPHVALRIAADGEIHVRGSRFAGYLGEPASAAADDELATGDIGYLDADGYLHLTGRKKNMFITAFGRNVAPEWVERELTLEPAIAQAAVYGEGRPWNAAVIVARGDGVAAALANANRRLPDYARVEAWVAADQPFTVANGQLTGTGRPRRAAIWSAYAGRLDELYPSTIEKETA